MIFWLLLMNLPHVSVTQKKVFNLEDYQIYNHRVRVSRSEQGVLCLLDMDDMMLVFVDEKGTQIARTGGRGNGPGQFRRFGGVQWDSASQHFLVFDVSSKRLSRWNEKGLLLDSQNLSKLRPNPVLVDGDLIFAEDFAGSEGRTSSLIRMDLKTGVMKTLWTYDFPVSKKFTQFPPPSPTVIYADWDEKIAFAYGKQNLVVTHIKDSFLHLLDKDGVPLNRSFSSELPKVPVTEAHVEAQIEKALPRFRKRLEKHLVVPEYWPSVQKIVIDPSDRIWVFGYPHQPGHALPFNILNFQGTVLSSGRIDELPQLVTLEVIFYVKHRPEQDILELVEATYSI